MDGYFIHRVLVRVGQMYVSGLLTEPGPIWEGRCVRSATEAISTNIDDATA